MRDVTNSLKSARLKKGLKQNAVAKELDITKSYLSKIEHGVVQPTKQIEEKLKRLYA